MPDYFLHVDILVEEKNAPTFEAMVEKLVRNQVESQSGAFYNADWQLQLALKATTPFDFAPPPRPVSEVRVKDTRAEDKLCRRYVNLWQVPDPPDVAKVMQQLADDSVYSGINAIVVREIQNLVLAVQSVQEVRGSASGLSLQARFVQFRRQFLTKDLGPYLFTAGALIPTIESKGYKTYGHYQNVTGHLNTVVELWQLPPTGKPTWKELADGALPGVRDMFLELEQLPQAEWLDSFQPYINLGQ